MERITRLFIFYKEYFTLLMAVTLSTLLLLSNDNRQINRLQAGIIDLTGSVQRQFAWVNQIFTALDENRIAPDNTVVQA